MGLPQAPRRVVITVCIPLVLLYVVFGLVAVRSADPLLAAVLGLLAVKSAALAIWILARSGRSAASPTRRR